jgi:hypothetical protein
MAINLLTFLENFNTGMHGDAAVELLFILKTI